MEEDDVEMDDMQYEFHRACDDGNVEKMRALLKNDRVDPSVNDNKSIVLACGVGCIGGVRLLLKDKRVDPSDCDNAALRTACMCGRTNIIRVMLQNPRVEDPYDFVLDWMDSEWEDLMSMNSDDTIDEMVDLLRNFREEWEEKRLIAMLCMKRCKIYRDLRRLIFPLIAH